MKIIVLGGAGKQGSHAAALLATKGEITEVVLADASEKPLQEAAAKVGPKARPVLLDAADEAAVSGLLTEAPKPQVVLNTVGPGFRFAVPMMRLAIAAEVDYVDIQDDAEIVADVEALDATAKSAGRTMISGLGLTPGLSQVLVRHASGKLDTVDRIEIAWIANMTSAPSVANWGHRLGIWSTEVPIVDGGTIVTVPGGSGEMVIHWPEPVGDAIEHLCAHPEPLTLHKRFPTAQHISVRGGYTPKEHDEFVARLSEFGLISYRPVRVNGAELTPLEFMSTYATTDEFRAGAAFQQLLAREEAIGDNNGLQVRVSGSKDGRKVAASYTFFSRDRNIGIYTPAAVATYMVATGQIATTGVLFPEDLDPQPIIDAVRAEGVTITEEIE